MSGTFVDKKNYQTANNNAKQIKLWYNFIIHLGRKKLRDEERKESRLLLGHKRSFSDKYVTHGWRLAPSVTATVPFLLISCKIIQTRKRASTSQKNGKILLSNFIRRPQRNTNEQIMKSHNLLFVTIAYIMNN